MIEDAKEAVMKTIRLLPVLLAVALTSACVPLASLHPLWDESHQVALPALAGLWVGEDASDTLKFTAAEKGAYKATYCSKDGMSEYEVHAVAIHGKYFLDFYPDSEALEKRLAGESYLPVIPMHFFGRLVLDGDSLKLALLDDEAVQKKVGKGELNVPLQRYDDGILLTADTSAIQELVAKFAEGDDLWGETATFTRARICGFRLPAVPKSTLQPKSDSR
jgi:hypothetical protein